MWPGAAGGGRSAGRAAVPQVRGGSQGYISTAPGRAAAAPSRDRTEGGRRGVTSAPPPGTAGGVMGPLAARGRKPSLSCSAVAASSGGGGCGNRPSDSAGASRWASAPPAGSSGGAPRCGLRWPPLPLRDGAPPVHRRSLASAAGSAAHGKVSRPAGRVRGRPAPLRPRPRQTAPLSAQSREPSRVAAARALRAAGAKFSLAERQMSRGGGYQFPAAP